jgi:class 3 adenylate cyclase
VLPPRTRFASLGEDRIAFQVWGDAPIAAVFVYGFFSHIELNWEVSALAHLFSRLGRSMRVVQFDRRGAGLSDRPDRPLTLEDRVDDLLAIVDAAGLDRVALLGLDDGAAASIMAAAGHPDRISHLVLYSPLVRMLRSDDFPWGAVQSADELRAIVDATLARWGDAGAGERLSLGAGEAEHELIAKYQRSAISPRGYRDVLMASLDIDVRPILPILSTPTLILHKRADPTIDFGQSRYLIDHVQDARLVELSGSSHLMADDDAHKIVEEITRFLTGRPPVEPHDRVLATVLFTDLVASTPTAYAQGDARWREILDDHDRIVRRAVQHHRGRLVKMTGDGVLATFDGPARAIHAGQTILEEVRQLGLEARAGVHTGEIELRDQDVAGISVHIGARIAELAQPNQLLVSRTVVDLIVGARIDVTEIGTRTLPGVPGTWPLFAVGKTDAP